MNRPLAALAVVLALAACSDDAANPAAAPLSPGPTRAPTTATQSEPEPPSTPTINDSAPEARLEELRASDAYLEFAEADRARHAPGADRAIDGFGTIRLSDDGSEQIPGEPFSNLDDAWNATAPQVRDDLLLAGEQYVGPVPEIEEFRPAVYRIWPTASVEGRGEVSAFLAAYQGPEGPTLRVHPVLVPLLGGAGAEAVVAEITVGEPIDLMLDEFEELSDILRTVADRTFQWTVNLPPANGATTSTPTASEPQP